MDFMSSREGFVQAEESSTIFRDSNHKNPSFTCSSSTNNNEVWEAQTQGDQCEMGTWLGHKLESYQESSTERTRNHHEFMELSPPKIEHDEDDNSRRNNANSSGTTYVQKEHMFDKVVTPSDVGKLNRLVIPKQYAERFFPLDSSTIEKGLLLSFEDRDGKSWRFRYSYWNSSQSYVMTKGWSRFVKDKKLDAGDTVSFQRGVGEKGKDRLYIDCRRRPDGPNPSTIPSLPLPHQFSLYRSVPWNSPVLVNHPPNTLSSSRDHLYLSQLTSGNYSFRRNDYPFQGGFGYGNLSYGNNIVNRPVPGGSMLQFRSNYNSSNPSTRQKGADIAMMGQRGGAPAGGGGSGSGGGMEPVVFDSVPVVVQGKAAAKRLRLFGVNMECPINESDELEILSSTTVQHSIMSTQKQHPPLLSSSSSSQANYNTPSHQFMFYNGAPLRPRDSVHKGKASMSLDFDI